MSSPAAMDGQAMAWRDASPAAALAGTLEKETLLLLELSGILERQRDGVGADDVEAVSDSVYAAHRVLRTLGEARRRRRALLERLVGSPDTALHELDELLGPAMTPTLRDAVASLRRTAEALSREIAVNRRVLAGAIRFGEEHMQALCGGAVGQPSYGHVLDGNAPAWGGTLLNRRV